MAHHSARSSTIRNASRKMNPTAWWLMMALMACVMPIAGRIHAQSNALTTWAVSIVLPPKLVAGKTATLAVLGVDGRLAEGITISIGDTLKLKTDKTGRASFLVPADRPVVIASGSGNSSAALVDAPQSVGGKQPLVVAPVVSLVDQFSICGADFLEQADANRVSINDERAFVLAASPECVVVLANPRALPGPARITIENAEGKWEAATTLVSLHFDPPIPPLIPGKKSKLALHVQGSDQQLRVQVENRTPGVLRFLRGDTQSLLTSGADGGNSGEVSVEAVSAGDFSLRARILPAADPASARRYLLAAAPLAPKEWKSRMNGYAHDLERHPHDTAKVSRDLQVMTTATVAGDFKTLLEAARAALQ
jgi:hypothetical protein